MVVFLYGWNFPRHRLTSNVFLFSLPQHRGFNGVFKKLRLCRHGTLGPVSGGVRGYPPDNDPTLVFDGIDRLHRRPEGIIFFFPRQLLLYFRTTIIIFPDNIYYFFTDKLLFFHRHYLQVVFVPTTRTVRTTLLQVMDDIVVAVRSFHTIDGKMMTLIRLHEGALKK
jgi:hypothetical protein